MIFASEKALRAQAQNMRDYLNNQGSKVMLFKNDWVEDCVPLIADLTEANFDGYARQTVGTWLGPFWASPVASTSAPLVTFTCTGGGTPNTIYGYGLVSIADGLLLWAEKNPAGPVTISAAGQVYVVVPNWSEATWDLIPCPV